MSPKIHPVKTFSGKDGPQQGFRTASRGQGSPVKFATLVFFEEFNGASRGLSAEGRGQSATKIGG